MVESIRPGTTFHDDRGRVAQLHGVGVIKVDDRYWAFGEDKAGGNLFGGINGYSSTNLSEWRFEGVALAPAPGDLSGERIVERPKVLFCSATKMYVMFVHLDSPKYDDARVGVAQSSSVFGPYELIDSFRPLGNESRDIGVFQEGATGYLLSEDRNAGLHIYRLSDDYLHVEHVVVTLKQNTGTFGYESPALVKHEGIYYVFGSDLTYWDANDNQYSTSRDLKGPWTRWEPFAPIGSGTFSSQISTIATVESPVGSSFIYIGDRWMQDDLGNSPAVWLPIQLDQGRAELVWKDDWSVNELNRGSTAQ